MTMTASPLPSEHMGPAEKLLDLVLNSSAHLWHNRPGVEIGGVWFAAKSKQARAAGAQAQQIQPGLHTHAAVELYTRLLEIYELNVDLMAHFASYALLHTRWRDLKVATAALMLVQPHAGQAISDEHGNFAFHDDDLREIGAAMMLHYERKSTRMLTPKAILRVAELLEREEIAALNRSAGFGDPSAQKPILGRWAKVATRWLAYREANEPMLAGLVRAGYKQTIMKLARKVGYKPQSERFFALLGWKQSQAEGGHRELGLDGLELEKRGRFDELSEMEICETIATQKLDYKDVVGRLPADIGLTPAILVAALPSLSDRDLRRMTPTLEEMGLMAEPEVRDRWEQAIEAATDQRGLNLAKRVHNKELKQRLEASADVAAREAVNAASGESELHVMFLIDRSGSMQRAIDKSKEALSRILAGFPPDRVHIASFDTFGMVHQPKTPSRAAVVHMLGKLKAAGGTLHFSAVKALFDAGVRIPAGAKLVVIVVGDEAGESGDRFAAMFETCGYTPQAMALILNVVYRRGDSVRGAAELLGVPFSTVTIEQFDDPYQVPRVLQALLEAPASPGQPASAWVAKIMQTPLLTADPKLG